jgi:inosine-uridine nucleoside N-ribohydrolase
MVKRFRFNVIAVTGAALFVSASARCAPHASPATIPIILDTDIGTDIDDAFALALVMSSPELQLVGVTTVSGDAQARARLAAKLLWVAGGSWRQVPVYAGASSATQPIEQTMWAQGFTSPMLHPSGAVNFMRSEISRRPGQITIVAIGALTNVAALLKLDPSMAKKVRRIALMGGSVARGYAPGSPPEPEWNIKSDPAAAQTVFSSGVPILMAPLDVTAMLQLDDAGRHRVFTHLAPVTNALAVLYFLWGHPIPVLYDPMAVALVIDPKLCELKPLAISVDAQGYTRAEPGRPANAEVGMQTDAAKFFEFYLGRVAPANTGATGGAGRAGRARSASSVAPREAPRPAPARSPL